MSTPNKVYRGLGRGLESLLSSPRVGTPVLQADDSSINSLPISSLQSGRFQPRTTFDEEQLSTLAESIKTQGIVQPIVVRQLDEDISGKYEIIAGERRWRAAQKAGLTNLPVIIRNDLNDQQSMVIALIENIQRADLNIIEEAEGLQRLNLEFSLTHEEIANIVGRSRAAITNSLRLLDLNPDVQNMVREDKLKMGHARALLSLDHDQQYALANEIYAKKLTTREVEKMANNLSKGKSNLNETISETNQHKELLAAWQDELSNTLNRTVKITCKSTGKSNINIGFNDIEELRTFVEKLKG